ncbi:hypothetical protein [Stigmatella aurantiaca]|uniref:Uncharacterized protein n=1 Tax=Stigmatella aurantiaca (strain DW4/3-1) TaxID=378806 RepID=E3FWT8_STIAD|nr:hypothetical protein [Stigmatella aurantiaca]ADO69801.1 uncharacterized protein STAUR_1997 [Stigmatella aurantiaca DW4/3-1]
MKSYGGADGFEKKPTTKLNTVKNHQPAKNFRQLIDLVRATEERLIANDYDDVEDRIHVIRGVYYGTVWSADYQGEKSPVRKRDSRCTRTLPCLMILVPS